MTLRSARSLRSIFKERPLATLTSPSHGGREPWMLMWSAHGGWPLIVPRGWGEVAVVVAVCEGGGEGAGGVEGLAIGVDEGIERRKQQCGCSITQLCGETRPHRCYGTCTIALMVSI